MLKIVYIPIFMMFMNNGEVLEIEGGVYESHQQCVKESIRDAREMTLAKGPSKMYKKVESFCTSVGVVGKEISERR